MSYKFILQVYINAFKNQIVKPLFIWWVILRTKIYEEQSDKSLKRVRFYQLNPYMIKHFFIRYTKPGAVTFKTGNRFVHTKFCNYKVKIRYYYWHIRYKLKKARQSILSSFTKNTTQHSLTPLKGLQSTEIDHR